MQSAPKPYRPLFAAPIAMSHQRGPAAAIQGRFSTRPQVAMHKLGGTTAQARAASHSRPGLEAFPVELQHSSGGWPLPRDVQAKMEGALGSSFADVRIHVGAQAASIGALAFTWGSDLYFAPGQYNPHTTHGQFLLGHELQHVVQQRAGRVRNPFGTGVAVVQDFALEAEADRMGQFAANWRPTT